MFTVRFYIPFHFEVHLWVPLLRFLQMRANLYSTKKSIIFEEIRDFLQFLSICYSLKHTNLCHELQVLNKYHKIFISWKCIYIQHGLNSSLLAVNTLCKMKTFYQNRKPFCRTGSSVFYSAENKLSQTLQKVQNKVMSRNYASFF